VECGENTRRESSQDTFLCCWLAFQSPNDNARAALQLRGHLEQVALLTSAISKGSLMIIYSQIPCQTSLVRPITCPRCGEPLDANPEDVPNTTLSDHVAHALIDHFLAIEAELQQIRRLLTAEILP
jgi:hypothetical protein